MIHDSFKLLIVHPPPLVDWNIDSCFIQTPNCASLYCYFPPPIHRKLMKRILTEHCPCQLLVIHGQIWVHEGTWWGFGKEGAAKQKGRCPTSHFSDSFSKTTQRDPVKIADFRYIIKKVATNTNSKEILDF